MFAFTFLQYDPLCADSIGPASVPFVLSYLPPQNLGRVLGVGDHYLNRQKQTLADCDTIGLQEMRSVPFFLKDKQ